MAHREVFLAGDGEMGERIRGCDWSASPLGPNSQWTQPLKTLVGVMLASNQPMFIVWGPERTLLYNNAYAEVLAGKHPDALGRDFLEVWSEIRADLVPIVDLAYAGEPVHMDDIELVMLRKGFPERTHFAFSYTPMRDEAGTDRGFFCPCVEITAQVLVKRQQKFRFEIEERLRGLADPDTMMTVAVAMLAEHLAVERVGYGEVLPDDATVRLSHCHACGVEPLLGDFPLDSFGPDRIVRQRRGETEVCADVLADPGQDAAVWASIYTRAFVSVPLVRDGRLRASLYINAREPRRWSAEDVALVEEVAARTWDAVERARAEAALRASEARLSFLDRLSAETAALADADAVLATTTRLLGEHLKLSVCAYADMDEDQDGFTIRGDWAAPGSKSIVGHYSLADFGKLAVKNLSVGLPLVVGDNLRDLAPEEAATFQSIGISATICMPLVKEGRLTALMAIHDRVPRAWTEAELGLLREVTARSWAHVERVAAVAELRASEARFRLMADAVPQIVWITDPEGRAEFFNRQWTDYTGFPYESTTASEVAANHVHPDDAAATMAAFEKARRTGTTFLIEHRIRSRAGEYRWFLVRGEPQRDLRTGKILSWFGASVDIHDRRSNEEANARLAAIVASTTDAIIAFAAEDGRILAWNRGAEELFGYIAAEALGRSVGLLVPPDLPDGDPTGVFRRAMEGARVHEHETARVTKSGERIPVAVTASRMLAPGGRAIGVAAIFRDLRQRKASEERQALLSREVDHRAKNALAVVQAALRLTKAPDLPSYIRAIEGRVGALARAQTLLADDRWAGADLRTLLKGELAPFLRVPADEQGAASNADLHGPPVALPPGMAQPLAMTIHELATNALKYGALSSPAGRISVSWRLTRAGPAGMPLLRLRWAETGGPTVLGPPERRGFGSRVIEGTMQNQLGGSVSIAWEASGLVCDIEVPLARADASAPDSQAAD